MNLFFTAWPHYIQPVGGLRQTKSVVWEKIRGSRTPSLVDITSTTRLMADWRYRGRTIHKWLRYLFTTWTPVGLPDWRLRTSEAAVPGGRPLFDDKIINLPNGALMRIEKDHGNYVMLCLYGALWITQEGDLTIISSSVVANSRSLDLG